MQIVKRKRELTLQEVQKLCEIAESSESKEDLKVGAYLLLSNQVAAQVHFNKLTEEEQESFKTYPIYYFWTETAESKETT